MIVDMPAPSPVAHTVQADHPLISVVIPALTADAELRRCVDSVHLACSGQPYEILIVMPSREHSRAHALLPDERLIAESRPSIYGAMNDGIAASRGRYLYFIGKDDILLPTFGEALDDIARTRPSAMFFDVYWGSTGIFPGRPSRWRLLARNLCHQGIVYSREVLVQHGPYVRRMRVQADHLLNIRLLWDAQRAPRVRYLPRPLAWYSGAGFSSHEHARDPTFWRLYPTTMRRYVGAWAACLLVMSRKVRGR